MQRDHLFDLIRTVATRLMKDASLPALPRQTSEQRMSRQVPTEALTYYSRALLPTERPTRFLLHHASRVTFPTETLRAFVDAGGSVVSLGREGERDVAEGLPMDLLSAFVNHPAGDRQLLVAIRAGFREAAARAETGRARAEAALRSREIGELTRIGVALGTERDLKTLL